MTLPIGNISSEEFGRVMKQHDPKVTDAEVAQIVREVDLDGDGTINFGGLLSHPLPCWGITNSMTEFISMMTGRTKMPELAPEPEPVELPTEPEPKRNVTEPDSAIVEDSEADFKAAWKEFDPSLKSSITASQLRQLVANMGETISDEEVDGIVNSIDDEDRIICE